MENQNLFWIFPNATYFHGSKRRKNSANDKRNLSFFVEMQPIFTAQRDVKIVRMSGNILYSIKTQRYKDTEKIIKLKDFKKNDAEKLSSKLLDS